MESHDRPGRVLLEVEASRRCRSLTSWRSRFRRELPSAAACSMPVAAWVVWRSNWPVAGIDVVGVDLDDDLLAFARRSQPSIQWVHDDLATMQLRRRFDVVAMPGNVMVYCRPSRSAGHHQDSRRASRAGGVSSSPGSTWNVTERRSVWTSTTQCVRPAISSSSSVGRPGTATRIATGRMRCRCTSCGWSPDARGQLSQRRRAITLRHSVSSAPSKMLKHAGVDVEPAHRILLGVPVTAVDLHCLAGDPLCRPDTHRPSPCWPRWSPGPWPSASPRDS